VRLDEGIELVIAADIARRLGESLDEALDRTLVPVVKR
jgi:hypothetical protein